MKLFKSLTACSVFAAIVSCAMPANAISLFSQDFESGSLTPSESITAASPGFGVTNTSPLGNGTFGVGHESGYVNGGDNFTDFYQLSLDLTGFFNTQLSFDFNIDTESCCDEFGVAVDGTAIIPSSGYTPNNAFDGTFPNDPSTSGISGTASGTAIFDLSAFDGQTIDVQIGLAPDPSVTEPGFFIDNVNVSAEPVPFEAEGTMGLVALGSYLYYRKKRSAKA